VLVWIVALHCEAKPVIDHYGLKKSASHHAFDVYLKDDMHCIISGIGKTAAAAATAWIAGLNPHKLPIAWINLGTAGSSSHSMGTAVSIFKISDSESNRNFYPVPIFDSGLEPAHCHTLGKPSVDYHPDQIFDMEASAFFEVATRFSSAELVQCLKIISDTPAQQTGRDKARISELINQHIVELAGFAHSLGNLANQVGWLQIGESDWEKILSYAHFTQTQQSRLGKSLRFLLSQPGQTDALITGLANLGSANMIIAHLENLCHQQTLTL
jgi:hypothetical protein